MIRKVMFCALLLLLTTHCAIAVPHKVSILVANKAAEPVVDALKARLRGTERYQVSDTPTDLVIQLACFDMETVKSQGVVCSFVFTYSHPATSLFTPIGDGGLLSAPDRAGMGEALFQSFVESTTEQKILDARANIESSISLFCSKSENAKTCGR